MTHCVVWLVCGFGLNEAEPEVDDEHDLLRFTLATTSGAGISSMDSCLSIRPALAPSPFAILRGR